MVGFEVLAWYLELGDCWLVWFVGFGLDCYLVVLLALVFDFGVLELLPCFNLGFGWFALVAFVLGVCDLFGFFLVSFGGFIWVL